MRDLQLGIAPSRSYKGTWWDMVEVCLAQELAGVEFKYELPFILPSQLDKRMLHRIKRVGEDEGLVFSVHGPYTNIGALLSKRWRAAVDEQLEALEVAEEVRAATYTVHLGWVEHKYATNDCVRECRDRTAAALHRMQRYYDGVTLCLENQNGAEHSKVKCGVTVADLHDMAARVGRSVAFTFDVGHANVLGGSPVEFFLALGPERIQLGHLHDNDGASDDHRPLGQGNIDWKSFLEAYHRRRRAFPLFLELSTEKEFQSGKMLIARLWSQVLEARGSEPLQD